jgi:DNA polymerase-1
MLLLIDGNNLAWAGYYALERAMKPDTPERQGRVAMLGLAGTVLGAIARDGEPPPAPGAQPSTSATPVTRVAIAFDEGRPLRRRQTYPPYQTGRENDPKFIQNEPTILAAIGEFARVCATLPVDVVRGKNTEADDLIAGLVRATGRARKRIVSTDRDFLQLIDAHTSVYAPVKKLVVDEGNFWEGMFGKDGLAAPPFPRDRFLDYRALTGDASDNLPGVPGVGPLSAQKLLAAAPLDAYVGRPDAVRQALGRRSEAVERAFADGSAREIVERNRALMDLRLPAPSWDDLEALTMRGTWDAAAFGAWFEEEKIRAVEEPVLFARLETLAAHPAATSS